MSNKPTPQEAIVAIHKKCLDCMCNSRKMVHQCTSKNCALWPWREPECIGKMKPDKGQITFFELIREE